MRRNRGEGVKRASNFNSFLSLVFAGINTLGIEKLLNNSKEIRSDFINSFIAILYFTSICASVYSFRIGRQRASAIPKEIAGQGDIEDIIHDNPEQQNLMRQDARRKANHAQEKWRNVAIKPTVNDIASIAGQVMPGSIALTADYDNNAGSGDTEAAVYLFSMAIALCLAVSSLKLYTEVEKAPLEFPTGLLNPAIPAEEPALLDQQEDLVVEEGGDSDSIFNWRPGPDNDDPEDDVFFDAQGDQGQRGGLRNEGLDDDVFLAALEERGNSDNIGYIRSDPKLSAQRSRYDLSELEGEIPSPEVNPIDSFQSASPEFSPGK